jgi:inorganic pyrophosphatase
MEISIAVEKTTASPIASGEVADLLATVWPGDAESHGYPVGEGRVPHTLTTDGGPAEALVLMEEPALPGSTVKGRPVALYHLLVDGRPREEVICVAAGDPHFEKITDPEGLAPLQADTGALAAVLRHLAPHHSWRVTGCDGHQAAEEYLAQARQRFQNLVGTLG